MDELTKSVIERGDLAHLALFLWASGASALPVWSLREMAKVTSDFDGVEKLAEDRAALWARVGSAEFLSDAEKRAMLGVG